jgi:hypothetical protein
VTDERSADDGGLSERDRLDGLIHLHRLHTERFYNRRQWEWRVTFTFWAGLAVAATALRGTDVVSPWVFWPVLLVTVWLHWYFERAYVYREAEANRDLGIALNDEINRVIRYEPLDREGNPFPPPNDYNMVAHYWQVGVTALLGLVVGAAIYWAAPPS